MNVERTRERLTAAEDGPELRRAARDFAVALVEREWSDLRELRSCSMGQKNFGPSGFADGYRAALLDLTTAIDEASAAERSLETARHFVASDRVAMALLPLLRDRTATINELASTLEADESRISRTLAQLRGLGLVEVFESLDRRERPHRLTILGHDVLVQLTSAGARASTRSHALKPTVEEFMDDLPAFTDSELAQLATYVMGRAAKLSVSPSKPAPVPPPLLAQGTHEAKGKTSKTRPRPLAARPPK